VAADEAGAAGDEDFHGRKMLGERQILGVTNIGAGDITRTLAAA
jgi:hypothetical protein